MIPAKINEHEVTPKVWTKNFWGFIMRKKHDREALLKYIAMLKEGRSFRSISDEFGINAERAFRDTNDNNINNVSRILFINKLSANVIKKHANHNLFYAIDAFQLRF